MAKPIATSRRDSTGSLITEWRGPSGEIAMAMAARYAGRCAGCNHPYPITPGTQCFVVRNAQAGWKLYHFGAECRPAWIELT